MNLNGAEDFVSYSDAEHLRVSELQHHTSIIDANQNSLDSLAALLAKLCGVPYAGISVVDNEHIWIKAYYGLEAYCLPREGAFCSAAVDSRKELFSVENALEDPLFTTNPLVYQSPDIRFYAASPFHSRNGFALGTVWIMDDKPVKLQQDAAMILRSLSAFLAQLLQQQYHCDITSLPNKSCFINKLQAIMNDSNQPVSVVAIHLQRLLQIRSIYGSEHFHEILRITGTRLQSWLKDDQPVAHLGTGNFAFARSDKTRQSHIRSLLDLLNEPVTIAGTTISVIASAAITTALSTEASAAALVDMAEITVTENTGSGQTRVDYGTVDHSRDQLTIDLYSSILEEQHSNSIEAYYQPQVDIIQGRLTGFEALMRWEHPRYQSVPAGEIFSFIDSLGLIPQVDLLIFNRVCQAIARWQAADLKVPKISTNLSRTTLQRKDLAAELVQVLRKHKISSQTITLEITETGFQHNDAETAERIRALHEAGFQLAIDDFGTGMSNIAALRDTCCDLLKVDRQFVHGVSVNKATAALLRLIKGTADAHQLQLLCEGVETQEDIDWLYAADIPLVQGWYFSKAMPARNVEQILRELQQHHNQPCKCYEYNYLRQLFRQISDQQLLR